MPRMYAWGLFCALCCANFSAAQTTAEPVARADTTVPTIHWSNADKAIGEVVFVAGKVIDVRNIGALTFINFDDARPAKFVAVVFRDNYGKFPDDLKKLYVDKIVKVRGQITTHRDKPQIVLTGPEQIEVVDKMPDTVMPKPRPRQAAEVRAGTVMPKRPVREAAADQLVIATYNVLNLFDEIDDPYHEDEGTAAKPREQLEQVAAGIRKLNADVIAFQEVESRGYLQLFVNSFLGDMGYSEIVHYDGNDKRGIDACLVSRIPVGPVRSLRHMKFTGADGTQRGMSRDLLQVTLLPPGKKPFEVWLVHLKSNHGGREIAEPIRLAECRFVRSQLDERLEADPDARILLMGDFNDTWHSMTLKTIVGAGSTALKLPLSEPEIKSLISYNREPHRSMIDFILATPAMSKQYVEGSYRTIPGEQKSSGSDHNPVVAWFEME